MRKFNKNSILFVAVLLFILYGLCSGPLVDKLYHSLKALYWDISDGNAQAVANFTTNVDSTSELLRYHGEMMDLNSAKENVLGTRIAMKEETTVVKSDSGSLLGNLYEIPATEENARAYLDYVQSVQTIAQENGAAFLYCSVLPKTDCEESPSNFLAYNSQWHELRMQCLRESGVPMLDSAQVLKTCGIPEGEIFFKTDHHWTPKTGFYMSGAICRELESRYGFSYDSDYTDLSNYQVSTLDNWFLGSYGKKVGTYFADWQVDDFDVITPKFETDLTEEVRGRTAIRTGSFEDTMLYQNYLVKDYYGMNNYAAYSGGDFRLQKITNNQNPDGAVIVIVRKSYGCVVTPFLALQVGQLHVIDDRAGTYPSGDPVDLQAYLQELQPDYVILLD